MNAGRDLRPWTASTAPDPSMLEPPSRFWSGGLGGTWGAVMTPIFLFGCAVVSGVCAPWPAWADAASIGFFAALPAGLVGLRRMRSWGPALLAAAALCGAALSTTDLAVVRWWGLMEIASFGLLFVWSVASMVVVSRWEVVAEYLLDIAEAPDHVQGPASAAALARA